MVRYVVAIACVSACLLSCASNGGLNARSGSEQLDYDYRGGAYLSEVTFDSRVPVESAVLRITHGQSVEEVPMVRSGHNKYSASWTVPSNRNSSGVAQIYRVDAVARDRTGVEHVVARQVTVKAAKPPPDPPGP